MAYQIKIDTRAAKEIKALPRLDQSRITAKMESLSGNPRPPGCAKLGGDSGLWRIRLGVYRIIYEIQDRVLLVTVVKVGNRRDVYRGM